MCYHMQPNQWVFKGGWGGYSEWVSNIRSGKIASIYGIYYMLSMVENGYLI